MAMQMVRTLSAGGLGIASSLGEPTSMLKLAPIDLAGTKLSWATIVEAAGLVVGAGLQFMAPFTMPNVADGLVDGGLALLAARGGRNFLKAPAAASMYGGYASHVATRVSPMALGGARAQNLASDIPKVRLQ